MMKNCLRIILSFIMLNIINQVYAQFRYISPLPGSKMHNKETTIILKNGNYIDESSLDDRLVTISGTLSGVHEVRIILSEDRKTIVISPEPVLKGGETVTVTIANGFKKSDGAIITGTTFQFETHPDWTPDQLEGIARSLHECKQNERGERETQADPASLRNCYVAPFEITSTANAFEGDIFYYNFNTSNPVCYARNIISNEGDSLYYEHNNSQGVDFKINKSGYISYHDANTFDWYLVDSAFSVIDTFQMGNGYLADEHEFQHYPNGHSFMFAYDVQPGIDLSYLDYGAGKDSMNVIGLVIHELDADHNVVFEWRSWDHMSYEDALFWVQTDLQFLPNGGSYDWVHGNSIELVDNNTAIWLSSRSLSEVTKISLTTGDIIWRLGGENNEFIFFNDTDDEVTDTSNGEHYYFSGQHDVRLLPNGHMSMFNNDNKFIPQETSAKEYIIDEVLKTATLAWRYVHPEINGQPLLANAMGSTQYLPNGNRFICWGLNSKHDQPFPRLTEVDSLGNIAWEFRWLQDDNTLYYCSYRAHKYLWDPCGVLDLSSQITDSITTHSAHLTWAPHSKINGYILEYKLCIDTVWTIVEIDSSDFNLENLFSGSCYEWRLRSICDIYNDTSLYYPINQFFTELSVSQYDLLSGFNLKVYPNPANEQLQIEFILQQEEAITLKIYDLIGRKITAEEFIAPGGNNHHALVIEELVPGIYTIEISMSGNSIRRQFVVE